jgi:hypothetical protein
VAVVALYATRRNIAEEALNHWLRSHGVQGQVEVRGFSASAATGRIVIGDPADPDLVIPRAELGYGLSGGSLTVRSVTLFQPSLRARLHAGRLSLGALDPLVEAFRKRPAEAGASAPRIVVQDGRVALATDAGALALRGDALLEKGRLTQLTAVSAPARLSAGGATAEIGAGRLRIQRAGERVALTFDAPAQRIKGPAVTVENGRLQVAAQAPYPDGVLNAAPVSAHGELFAARLGAHGQVLEKGLLTAAFDGTVSGGFPDLALAGRARGDLRAEGGQAGGGHAGPIRANLDVRDLRWTRKGGDMVSANASGRAQLDSYVGENLRLSRVDLLAQGPVSFGRSGLSLQLRGSAAGRGAWTGLPRPLKGETDSMAAVKRAARGFRFQAPTVVATVAGQRRRLALPQPARIAPDSGGLVTVAQRGAGWRLTSAGGGLPKAEADLDRVVFAGGGVSAHGRVRASLTLEPMEGAEVDAAGTLRLANGVTAFTGARCARFAIARLAFGQNDARRLAGELCPVGRPMLTIGNGWRIAGAARGASAEVPFLQAKLSDASGALDLSSDARGVLGSRMSLARGTVTDLAPARRFNPVGLTGDALLSGGVWRGGAVLSDPAGHALARLDLRHEMASGRGSVEIATGGLSFQPGGLQPAALSPMAAPLGSPVEGEAAFQGRFDWTPAAVASHGVLDVPRLDFVSPAGKVSGLVGHIVFDSLAPLHAQPGQTLRVAEIASPAGLVRDASVVFALDAKALTVGGGQASVAGGQVRIEHLELPLAPGTPIKGVLDLDGVQLHDLVEASPFGDRVDLQARVSGRIPFEAQGTRVRVTQGVIHATEPGRLSIQREALTGVAADGAVTTSTAAGVPAPAAAPGADTFTDFAYQAMENLAFSTLEASVDSRPDGRLAVLFHIIGKHDPPQKQEIRLSLSDLIARRFLDKKLPLPSGTGVNLTLDTTLNLDDLLADYAEFRRLHGSATVQP